MPKKFKSVRNRKRQKNKVLQFFSLSPGHDKVIDFSIFALIVFGMLMLLSVKVGSVTSSSNVLFKTAVKQLLIIGASYFAMLIMNKFFSMKFMNLIRWPTAFALFGANIIPLFFAAEKGARAWIRLPFFTLQPSEFCKTFMIAACAWAIWNALRQRNKDKSLIEVCKFPVVCLVAFGVEIAVQKDLGTLAIIVMIAFVCFIASDIKVLRRAQRVCIVIFLGGCIAGAIGISTSDFLVEFLENTSFSHIATRVNNAKNPYNDPYGEGYQPANALYGIADSKIFGKGFGESTRKFGYLTQAENDYIFAVLVEETGIFGLTLLLILYGLIIYRLFYYAFKTKELPYKVVLTGTASYLFIHFFFNVGGVGALIPMTGIPLLFISEGGSAMLGIMMSMGMAQKCISDIRINELKK